MLFLVQFIDEWLDFRMAELLSLLQLFNIDPSIALVGNEHIDRIKENQYFIFLNLPDESIAKQISERSVLVKSIFEHWASGTSLTSIVEEVKKLPENFINPFLSADQSWSIQINSFGRTITMEKKQEFRSKFEFLKFQGPVDIKNPSNEFVITFDYTAHRKEPSKSSLPLESPTYFGRLISKGGMKEAVMKYDLKKRLYLGPTSLDDSLALILGNLSNVQRGSLVFDPFVGTGSILIAMAHFGAICFGADIDPRVLRGEMYAGPETSKNSDIKRDVFENFKQYDLPLPELIRMDNHVFDRHVHLVGGDNQDCICNNTGSIKIDEEQVFCSMCEGFNGFFDAIVTDPPYGIRAGARKSGSKKRKAEDFSVSKRDDHVPATQNYAVEEVMLDLLHTAARSLRCDGFLTYLIPTAYDFTTNDLPTHPCFELVQICHQSLSTRHGRRAVVLKKIKNYTKALENQFLEYKQLVLKGEDGGFGLLMGKLKSALAADAFQNDSVVKQMSVLCSRRKESKARKQALREQGINFPPRKGEKRLSKKALKKLSKSETNSNVEKLNEEEMDI